MPVAQQGQVNQAGSGQGTTVSGQQTGAVAPQHGPQSKYMPADKFNLPKHEALARYGKSGQPIPADYVYRRIIPNFSRKDVRAETWIAVNEGAGTMTFINTYDGKTGAGYDASTFTQPLTPQRLEEKTKDMERVDISECPVCVSTQDAGAKDIKVPTAFSQGAEEVVGQQNR